MNRILCINVKQYPCPYSLPIVLTIARTLCQLSGRSAELSAPKLASKPTHTADDKYFWHDLTYQNPKTYGSVVHIYIGHIIYVYMYMCIYIYAHTNIYIYRLSLAIVYVYAIT